MKIRTSTIDTSKLSKVLFLIISIVIGIATALNYEITIGFILILILFLLFIKKPEIPLSIQFIGTIIYFYDISAWQTNVRILNVSPSDGLYVGRLML